MTDEQMIANTASWPYPGFLPLKRYRDERMDAAVLLDPGISTTDGTLLVFDASVFALANTPPSAWHSIPMTAYPTVAALLADGWIVD